MHSRTKALDISPAVRRAVWERDGERCVLCQSTESLPNAHYIARSQGGLGIERNIVTLCPPCHHLYDQSTLRPYLRGELRAYLERCYPDWDEQQLTYRR